MAMNNGNIGDNHFTSLPTHTRWETWIQLIPALIWDMDLLLVKCAVIPEAK